MTRIPVLVASLLALPGSQAGAATTFSPEEYLFVNNPIQDSLAVDYDADGDLDLVVSGESGLSVLRNLDGAGNFGPRQVIGTVRTQTDLLADLDDDGDPDILSVQLPGGSSRPIVWHRNDGGGAFAAAVSIRTENALMTMLAPTDVDGDGDLDLIWYDAQSDALEWMENTDGLGSFAAPVVLVVIGDLLFATLLDLNGDGIPDLTGRAATEALVWFPGQRSPALGFGASQEIAPAGLSRLASGDVDGDGDVDLVVAGMEYGAVEWLRNNGAGVFGAPLPVVTLADIPDSVRVVDLDGDDRADILYALFFEDVQWCRNTDGNGTFAAPVTVAEPSLFTFRGVIAADLTGDDRRDLVTVEETELSLRAQMPTGTTFAAPVSLATAVEDITDIAATDTDGDGDAEVLFSTEDGKVVALANNGGGQFGAGDVLIAGQSDLEVIVPAQIDGIGGTDLVALRSASDIVGWHAGDGAGSLGPPMVIDDFGFTPSAATVADFDGNGSADVAVAFAGDQNCAWFSQNPTTHAFTFRFLGGTISFTTAIASGDIDGDGDQDLVTGGSSDGTVYLYRNNGGGTFTGALSVGTTPIGLSEIALADLDGDGDLDIAAAESSGVESTVTALLNDGSGAFPASTTLLAEGAGVRSIAFGDLDQDGDVDFVSANFNSDSVTWHENDGAGIFTARALSPAAGSSPYTVALADLDGDGDLDVLNVSRFTGRVGWFRNDFRPPPPNDDPVTVWAWDLGVTEPDVVDLASDTDRDGLTLLQEFAFGTDPLQPDADVVSAGGSAGTPDFFFTFDGSFRARGTFIRRRDRVALGLTYTIEAGPDLIQWSELVPGTATNVNPDYQRVTLNRVLSGSPGRHFIRLRLSYAPPP